VGPFALENGLVGPRDSEGLNLVRIYNTNTRKVIHARFPVYPGTAEANLEGEYAIDGVSGSHARITLDFLNPEGSRTGKLFPTGSVTDTLSLPGESVTATLMDCGNPCVFVLASELGINPTILPSEFTPAMLARLDALRNAAAVQMGLVNTLEEAAAKKAVPKVCIMSAPATHTVLSGATVGAGDVDVVVRCMSSGDPHRALPITASLCTAAAAHVPGTVVHSVLGGRVGDGIVIGHASGTIGVDADVVKGDDGELHVPTARVFRTARKLFEGNVFYRL
jgi:2-methylaconitate cis-trans-isomerase PrpF